MYTPPAVPNSLTVDKPFDALWKELVPAPGSRFFVINNLDKSSGLINVSYSGNPESYVDCGQIEVWVDNARLLMGARGPYSVSLMAPRSGGSWK